MPNFTATEKKILEVLSDGMSHSKDEIRAVLPDDMAMNGTISVHIFHIRKKLQPIGQDIICEFVRRRGFYRHVVLLVPHSSYKS